MRFADKVAFITGGARGIGFTFARALADEGAAVVLADIDLAAASVSASEITSHSGRAIGVQCDASDEASVTAAVADAIDAFGGVDILINNAGKHLATYSVPLLDLPIEKWRAMLDLNVLGIVHGAKACRHSMRERGGGVIVNVASVAAWAYRTPYAISKLAVRGITAGLAADLAADGIRVNCIAPGLVDSPSAEAAVPEDLRKQYVETLQHIKRPGRMHDLVGALFYFCSADSSFVTGETLVIGGGFPPRI